MKVASDNEGEGRGCGAVTTSKFLKCTNHPENLYRGVDYEEKVLRSSKGPQKTIKTSSNGSQVLPKVLIE